MKTILNGSDRKYYLKLKFLIGKVIALPAVIAGNLLVGKEGPFVHISSIIA